MLLLLDLSVIVTKMQDGLIDNTQVEPIFNISFREDEDPLLYICIRVNYLQSESVGSLVKPKKGISNYTIVQNY